MKIIIYFILFFSASIISLNAQSTYAPAERVYKKTTDYVKDAFPNQEPEKESIWVYGSLRESLKSTLEDTNNIPARYHYWKNGNKTVWILEDIGKTQPIKTGVTVEDGSIIDISVLVYRETRGSEIQNRNHRAQYLGARLDDDNDLDKPINGISGSTLSANSMKRMGRAALILHHASFSDE
ncbi:MAG: FMN-binding protein [Proteobacteria bacterium]|jgi:hypothetical protein|nr:FMN-binding protein [Pseudomonadota bacterium]